ncbi:MAG: serine protease [Candidatus Aminicenantes bacterium]|jgi:S1-C subfamily serine protease
MPPKKLFVLLNCILSLSVFLPSKADEIPPDVTPYVRLGHLVRVSVFRNPTLDPTQNRILNTGQLVREEVVQMPVGSGTIISGDGLILTNNHVYQMENDIQFDKETQTLFSAQQASREMLVYMLKDNDPLKVPTFQYLAEPVSLDENHDTALLRIVKDKDGNPVAGKTFSYVPLGNPFGMRLKETLTIYGYPSKGGDTITITEGKFLGYYRDQRFPGLDGFIKTDAAMAPGNSGGAAMNKSALVGVPTAVTLPTLAGSDLGYIHPITWAAKVLTVAKHKLDFQTPEIPLPWFASDYNTDDTRNNIYVTGRVISSHSQTGIFADIILARTDRTLEQIEKLHLELEVVDMIYTVQRMHMAGLSEEQISAQFQMPLEEVKTMVAAQLSEDQLSADTIASLKGEFFYSHTQSDEEGFFILSVPKGQDIKLYIVRNSFFPIEKKITLGQGLSQNLGKITIFRQQ